MVAPKEAALQERASLDQRLDAAAAACARQGAKLTELRRLILGLVLEAGRPVGAYELLDRLKASRKGAAPPTVYRALDFLIEQGLIHRLAQQNSFVSCAGGGHHHHPVQLLICRQCGRVDEIEDAGVMAALDAAAASRGFRVSRDLLEVVGRCADCRDAEPAAATAHVPA